MKRFLFIQAIIACIAFPSLGQKKVEKYCIFQRGGWSTYNKENFQLMQGKVDSLFSFKDSSVQANLINAAATLKTAADLLNYMALQGWTFVSHEIERALIFKKEFDLSELKTQ